MAEAIRHLLSDPVRRAAMARAARERVLEEFGHAAMVRAYEKLYRQITGKSAGLIRKEA
jgi:glycosyltransferase involved in cell wall biosynthesis